MTQHDFTGSMSQPQGLVVQFTCGERAARRIEYVKIPWDLLDLAEITHHCDKAVRRRLIEIWSDQELPCQLDAEGEQLEA